MNENSSLTTLRLPPHNHEAEHALLGAILVNNRNYEKVSEFLRSEHFVNPIHGRIFEVCGRLIDKGQQADPVTVKGFLEQDGALGEVGGVQYLLRLANPKAGIINAADYGGIIRDLYIRRVLIEVGNGLVADAYSPADDVSPASLIEDATAALFAAMDAFERAAKNKGAATGTPTGFNVKLLVQDFGVALLGGAAICLMAGGIILIISPFLR